MNIIALSDLHNATACLEPLAETMATVDLILLVGDMTNRGTTETIATIVATIRKHNQSLLAVAGNWDGQAVSDYLERENISLHRRHVVVDGVVFVGVGGSLRANNSPNEISEADFALCLNQAIVGLDSHAPCVLVSHQPPFDTLTDRTSLNDHVGSKAVRSFIECNQPLICFTGHIHEGVGIDTIGRTQIINPGPVWNNHYAYAEIVDNHVCCLEIRRF